MEHGSNISNRNEGTYIVPFAANCRDISEYVVLYSKYTEIQDKYLTIRDVMPDMMLRIDNKGLLKDCFIPDGFVTFLEGGGSGDETIYDVLPPHLALKFMRHVGKALESKERLFFEYRVSVGGSIKYREVRILPCNNNEEVIALVRDITERYAMEKRLRELSVRDPLTGLYNRSFLEERMRHLQDGRYSPIGVIVCDVDGLKLINDSLGHITGDIHLRVVAGILKKCFRKRDIVARIGGDEFAVILRNCTEDDLEQGCLRIRQAAISQYSMEKAIPLTISVGCALSGRGPVDLEDLFQQADNKMYREKLHSSQSTRSAIVEIVTRLLEARDFITQGHGERMEQLLVQFGTSLQLPAGKLSELRLLAKFHDIGKVGIPDHILFKQGPLNNEEFEQIKRHSEIGYRIAKSSLDLCPIADHVLKHHEWWNGCGYPLGLKGKGIPLECRILSIVDAYDAMTNDRPYRKAMPIETALLELENGAGVQFDPELVPQFIQMLQTRQTLLGNQRFGPQV